MAERNTVYISGSPVECGARLATEMLQRHIEDAAQKLDTEDFEMFCCSLLSATGALIARNAGRDRAAIMIAALADVARDEAETFRGTLQ